MLVDLVATTTSDGVKLHGIFLEPEQARTDLIVDAVLMVHGSGGNFYASPSNPRAARLRDAGIPVALFNTRGHDVVGGRAGEVKLGNAFEILDDCRMDMAAAVGWLVGRGYARVGIWGSSLGATKVVYAQAKNQDPHVGAVIALGPLRFSHEYYSQCEMKELHLKHYEEAKALVAAGKPDQIMPVDFPNPNASFSAAVHLDRHCSERYDITKDHADKVTCPFLILTGTEEKHPRMLNVGRDMYELAKANPGTKWVHVEGGEHGLHNMDDVLFDEILGWLSGAKAPAAAAR